MQQSAPHDNSSDASSFAGFLATLAGPPRQAASPWNDDGLADDVATFSYEQALRTHTPGFVPSSEGDADNSAVPAASETAANPEPNPIAAMAPDRNLKRASITIRLSEAECAQVRQRAAEADLTVSAYLRSCAFEVESLRSQVKETLAQLRNTHPPVAADSKPNQWRRLWPFSRADR